MFFNLVTNFLFLSLHFASQAFPRWIFICSSFYWYSLSSQYCSCPLSSCLYGIFFHSFNIVLMLSQNLCLIITTAFGLPGYRLPGMLFFLYIVHSFLIFFTSYNMKWTLDIWNDMMLTSGNPMCSTQKFVVTVYLVTFLGVVSCYFYFLCHIHLIKMSVPLP